MIKEKISKLIRDSIKQLQKDKVFGDFNIEKIQIEYPEKKIHGDYSSNIAMLIAKNVKKSPIKTAELLSQKLKASDLFKKVEVAKPGFINFFISEKYFQKQISKILKEKDKYGLGSLSENKTVMVEYAHPNTHKLFHIGHLRNITNGEAVVRILEATGFKVIRANYQGDIGLHIAKCLWAMRKMKDLDSKMKSLKTLNEKVDFLSQCYVGGNKAYEENEKTKQEILEVNKQIYDKDVDVKDLWQKTRQWSLDYFEKIYKRVYTHFDRYYFESEVAQKGKEIVLKAVKKGIFKKSQGAVIFPGSEYGLHDRVFITSEDNPTYEAKDVELGRLQFKEYEPDLIIHNVGPEQKEYFEVVFKALVQVFPYTKGKEYHLVSGWVHLKEGKMSSREGNVIAGEWLIDEVKKRIKKNFTQVSDKIAEQIAVGAIKYSFLKVRPSTDVFFDIDESISLEGNSGPYLQYAYTRGHSVLNKSKIKEKELKDFKETELKEKEEMKLLKLLSQFPEIIEQSAINYAPNLICNFLFDLTQSFNAFYESLSILKAETDEVKKARLALVASVCQVLKNGLNLLGISIPEKM